MSMVVLVHVFFGTLAVFSGFIAMCSSKGNKWHRAAGKGYVISMLLMAIAGALAAAFLSQTINLIAAALTSYLVLTAWHAAKKPVMERGKFSITACFTILCVSIASLWVGWLALQSPEGAYQDFHFSAYFFLGGISMFAFILDGYLMLKRTLSPKQRLVRHIWRMMFSYFIAVGSLFTGPGSSAFPDMIQNSGVLSIPEPLVLLFMLFWVGKTLWGGKPKPREIETNVD